MCIHRTIIAPIICTYTHFMFVPSLCTIRATERSASSSQSKWICRVNCFLCNCLNPRSIAMSNAAAFSVHFNRKRSISCSEKKTAHNKLLISVILINFVVNTNSQFHLHRNEMLAPFSTHVSEFTHIISFLRSVRSDIFVAA